MAGVHAELSSGGFKPSPVRGRVKSRIPQQDQRGFVREGIGLVSVRREPPSKTEGNTFEGGSASPCGQRGLLAARRGRA